MQLFIDTNVFLRALIKEDPEQFEQCVELLKKIKRNEHKAITCHLVIAEIAWTLSSYYEFEREKIHLALESINNLRGLKLIDSYNLASALYIYRQKKVKFIDSMIASITAVRTHKMIVVSYDRDFDKIDVLRREPQQIIKEGK